MLAATQSKHRTVIQIAGLLMLMTLPLLFVQKGDFVLFLNARHTTSLDTAFRYISHLGNGLVFVPILIYALFQSFRNSIAIVLIFLVQALICLICKHLIFQNALRPAAFFGDAITLAEVDGVTHYALNTFPSGHTATAFAAAMCIILLFSKRQRWAFWIFVALLVGLSRVYLGQHFYADIIAGEVVGVFSATSVYIISAQISWPAWARQHLVIQRSDLSAERR